MINQKRVDPNQDSYLWHLQNYICIFKQGLCIDSIGTLLCGWDDNDGDDQTISDL